MTAIPSERAVRVKRPCLHLDAVEVEMVDGLFDCAGAARSRDRCCAAAPGFRRLMARRHQARERSGTAHQAVDVPLASRHKFRAKYIPIERVRAIPTRDGDHAVVDDDPWRHSHRRETSRSSTLRKPEVADDLVDRGVGSVFLGVDRKVWLERHCRREVPSVEHLAERLRVRQLAVQRPPGSTRTGARR